MRKEIRCILRLLLIGILTEFILFIDHEVLSGELFSVDCQEVGECFAQLHLVVLAHTQFEVRHLPLEVLEQGQKHQDETIAAHGALER
jgi:hypothetical protein